MNACLFLWDINWLHWLILSARIVKGLWGCETSWPFTSQFTCLHRRDEIC
jgi:hypothetical protein